MHRTDPAKCALFIRSQSCRTVNETCQNASAAAAPLHPVLGPWGLTCSEDLKLHLCPLILVGTQKRQEGRSRG